jgi:phosphosulfolactate synthase
MNSSKNNMAPRALALPFRTGKPRTTGLTAIMDVGIPLGELKDILTDYHNLVDIAKFGIGAAYICPRLEDKLDLFKQYEVQTCMGGTLFEKFYEQGKLDEYIAYLKYYDVEWVEVSNGTSLISSIEMLKSIEKLQSHFKVFAEVGSKDPNYLLPPSQWIKEISSFLDAGCSYIIMEGRASSSAGLYRENGEVRTGLVADIISAIDSRKLIFEAGTASSQMYFINLLGANVNLGNIQPRDLLLLEAERCALRNETFYLDDPELTIHWKTKQRK